MKDHQTVMKKIKQYYKQLTLTLKQLQMGMSMIFRALTQVQTNLDIIKKRDSNDNFEFP